MRILSPSIKETLNTLVPFVVGLSKDLIRVFSLFIFK